MTIKVDVGQLSPYTNNQRIVEVNGSTILECLQNIAEKFPELKLFDKDGSLLIYWGICVNGNMVYPDEFNNPVKAGDELSILLMIDGG